jgi:hypothetical protein
VKMRIKLGFCVLHGQPRAGISWGRLAANRYNASPNGWQSAVD